MIESAVLGVFGNMDIKERKVVVTIDLHCKLDVCGNVVKILPIYGAIQCFNWHQTLMELQLLGDPILKNKITRVIKITFKKHLACIDQLVNNYEPYHQLNH